MARKVYFYSRTGTCAKVADRYTRDGAGFQIQVQDIPEDRYWGLPGYIKGSMHAFFKKSVSYSLKGDRYSRSETISEVVIITPVWSRKIPPTFRSFLLNESFDPDITVHVVTVSRSGRGRDVFRQIVDILQEAGVVEIRHKNIKAKDIV